MSRGISLHIGLNHVDPNAYGGWDGELAGCINDARAMRAIADGLGYTSSMLNDAQASVTSVCSSISAASRTLVAGDTFLLTYSGHGGQVDDVTSDESDGQDETWVLWDRQLIDDELSALWAGFAAGVRIIMISDSCHSGTVARLRNYDQRLRTRAIADNYERRSNQPPRFRAADPKALAANYAANRDSYRLSQYIAHEHRSAITASVLLISGCQDNQLSADGDDNGLFTQRLLEVWNGGSFQGDYERFHAAIVARMPAEQTPNLFRTGVTDAAFDAERPFTLQGAGAGASTGALAITAPASFADSTTPPSFRILVPQGCYYAVEVATSGGLFDSQASGSSRTADNFYASWSVLPFLGPSNGGGSTFSLPSAVWQRLRGNANALYYRLWCSDSATRWLNSRTTLPDAQSGSAPRINLQSTQPTAGTSSPTIAASTSLPDSANPPRFEVDPGPQRYYAVEVTTNPWYFDSTRFGGQRTPDNFYATWVGRPYLSSPFYPAAFELPRDVWERLRAAGSLDRLYYRMWYSDSPDAWVNAGCTTMDANAVNAPSIILTRQLASHSGRRLLGDDRRHAAARS